MELRLTELGEEARRAWSQVSDEEFVAILREEEAASALVAYLRERASEVGPHVGEERVYEYNPNFPFPILQTAIEIARVVLGSAGSYGFEQDQPIQDQSRS